MKRIKNKMNRFIGAILFFLLLIPTSNIFAADTYTVTFRAGNVGTFDVDRFSSVDGNVEVTDNYIRFTVEKGTDLTTYFADDAALMSTLEYGLTTEDSYFLQDISEWGTSVTSAVYRNEEYVLDYGMLVDGVEYTISYIDANTGEQIAAPTIAYRNAGETIVVSPLAIGGYTTTDAAKTIILEKDAANAVTFSYTIAETSTTVNTIINYITGTATTTIGTNTVATNTAGATPAAADGQDEVVIPDDNVPLDNGTDESAESNIDETTINEDEVPLDAGVESSNSYLIPITIGMVLLVLIMALGTVFYLKKCEKK